MDPDTREILLCNLTKNPASDSDTRCHLLDEMKDKTERVFGDGAYNDKKFRKNVECLIINKILRLGMPISAPIFEIAT
jgi:hypothetical protein